MEHTIWVVNEAGHPTWLALDVVPGAKIKPLTKGREQNPLFVDRLNYHLAEGIGSYAKAEDYLLISGSPTINAMAVLLWVLKFGEVKLLQWNASPDRRCYELSTVTRENLEHLLEKFMTGVG